MVDVYGNRFMVIPINLYGGNWGHVHMYMYMSHACVIWEYPQKVQYRIGDSDQAIYYDNHLIMEA